MKNNKSLGQHWLRDRAVLEQIAKLAKKGVSETSSSTTCLEIGPGLGTLTAALLRQFDYVIAVEYDPRLAHNLPASFPGKNLTVINQDFLDFDLTTVPQPYVVAGNVPYYITSPIITKLLTASHTPERIVLLIQREVAQRIAATPGHHTYLSLFVQNYAAVTLGPVVGRELFTPPPQVDSQIIILNPLPTPQVSADTLKLIKLGFSAPRKKLAHNLAAGLHCDKSYIRQLLTTLGLDPDTRPATLSLSDWRALQAQLTSDSPR